jgi:hypothetical protein
MHRWLSLAKKLDQTLFPHIQTLKGILLSRISRTSVKYFSHPNCKFTSELDTVQDLLTWFPMTEGPHLLKMDVLHNGQLKDTKEVV